MNGGAIPIIRLEVEHMKVAIVHALSVYAAQMDTEIQRAVEEFCTADNVGRIVSEMVNTTLRRVINDEIRRFYEFGAGQAVIREAVERRLRP